MYVSVIVSVPVCAHMFMRHCVYDTIADINDACHQSVLRRGEGKAWLQGEKTETEAVEEGRTREGGESRNPYLVVKPFSASAAHQSQHQLSVRSCGKRMDRCGGNWKREMEGGKGVN